MRLTADTNILLRSLLNDDPVQSPLAQRALAEAELVAIPLTVFCELVWILRGRFKLPKAEISETILRLTQSANVVTHQPAVEADWRFLMPVATLPMARSPSKANGSAVIVSLRSTRRQRS